MCVQHGPFRLAADLGSLPFGHALAPVRNPLSQARFDLPNASEDFAAQPVLVRRKDSSRGFMRVVDEREHLVVVALTDRVELVVVALSALHRQAQHRFSDSIHAVKHGLHAELLGVGPAFGVDHRIAQKAGRHTLLLSRARQQVTRDLLDHEPVVRHVRVQGVNDPIAIEPDLAWLVFLKAI